MTNLLKIGISFLIIQAVSVALGSSEATFEIFKGLQGKWAIQADGKTLPIEMLYEVGSKGSIVTEQFGKELFVFYRDGQGLMMIHFCNAGNQPRLRLKANSRPGFLEPTVYRIANVRLYKTSTTNQADNINTSKCF